MIICTTTKNRRLCRQSFTAQFVTSFAVSANRAAVLSYKQSRSRCGYKCHARNVIYSKFHVAERNLEPFSPSSLPYNSKKSKKQRKSLYSHHHEVRIPRTTIVRAFFSPLTARVSAARPQFYSIFHFSRSRSIHLRWAEKQFYFHRVHEK